MLPTHIYQAIKSNGLLARRPQTEQEHNYNIMFCRKLPSYYYFDCSEWLACMIYSITYQYIGIIPDGDFDLLLRTILNKVDDLDNIEHLYSVICSVYSQIKQPPFIIKEL